MKLKLYAILLIVCFLVAGCTSVINTPDGKVVSVTTRGIGLAIDYAPQTGSPEIKFGFFSSAIVIIPTNTNKVVTPEFANSFSFDQQGALQLGIGEEIASGNHLQRGIGTNFVSTSTNTNKIK